MQFAFHRRDIAERLLVPQHTEHRFKSRSVSGNVKFQTFSTPESYDVRMTARAILMPLQPVNNVCELRIDGVKVKLLFRFFFRLLFCVLLSFLQSLYDFVEFLQRFFSFLLNVFHVFPPSFLFRLASTLPPGPRRSSAHASGCFLQHVAICPAEDAYCGIAG